MLAFKHKNPMSVRTLVTLHRNTNQCLGLADYAKDVMQMDSRRIDEDVYDRVRLFHTDSVICGISAISMKTNAPTILRKEAIHKYSVSKENK